MLIHPSNPPPPSLQLNREDKLVAAIANANEKGVDSTEAKERLDLLVEKCVSGWGRALCAEPCSSTKPFLFSQTHERDAAEGGGTRCASPGA